MSLKNGFAYVLGPLNVCLVVASSYGLLQYDCSKAEYNKCIRIADPLIKETQLIIPDNMDDIDLVCRTWNNFVDCLKRYTDRCFNDQQRRQFNKAVENPIESVHLMCTQPLYQKEYLQYAPCIKNTVTQRIHCGPHYSLLVDQVAQGDTISKTTLCCSHDQFRQCVLRETRRVCDRGLADGPASRFSIQIIDKALSFLQDQCYNYIPNSGDCAATDTLPFSDPFSSSASSEVYPWSTVQEMVPKEVIPQRMTPLKETSSPWLPSPSLASYDDDTQSGVGSTQILGSRSRPASYGRSSSWSESSSEPNINTAKMYPEASPTISPRPDWATISTWHVMGQSNQGSDSMSGLTSSESPIDRMSSVSPTFWYPAAGNQLDDDVEVPNRQELIKPKDNGSIGAKNVFSLTVVATILTAFC